MKRTLSLKREALTALTTDELTAFGGGLQATTPPWLSPGSLNPKECLATTQDSRLYCNTWDTNCSC